MTSGSNPLNPIKTFFISFTGSPWLMTIHSATGSTEQEVTVALNKETYGSWSCDHDLGIWQLVDTYENCSILQSHDHHLRPSLLTSNKQSQ